MNKYFAMTFAALAFCACSNDEVPGKDGPDSGKPGEPTYAYFSMKINGEASTKATNAGSTEEQKVTDAVLIICKNLISDKSVEDVIYVDNLGTSDPYPAPETAVLTTSGDKKVYVVLNPKEATKTDLLSLKGKSQTDVENFKINLGEAGNLANSHNTASVGKDGSWTLDNLSNLPAAVAPRTIMSGAVTVTLEGNRTQEKPNKVAIPVDRSVGKAEVGFKDANVLKVADETKTILTLSDPFFAIRNLPVDEYIIQKKQAVTNYVMAPGFALSTSDEFDAAFDEVAPITGDVSVGGSTPASAIRYISENSNQTPMRGNTSYAIVKTAFKLEAKTVATSYTPGTDGMSGGTLTLNQGEFTTGLLMYTGTEFFEASKAGVFDAEAAINRWAAYTISISNMEDGSISDSPSAVAPTEATNAKKISGTIYESDEQLWEAVDGKSAYGYALIRKKADGIETVVDSIQIYKFKGVAATGSLEAYKMGDPIQASFYKQAICYYRVNIMDKAYPQPSPMFYSILRNNWYKLNITKVTSIGYPNEDDVTVKPTDPLGANTHIQADITIKPWNIVDGDYEIGM